MSFSSLLPLLEREVVSLYPLIKLFDQRKDYHENPYECNAT